VLGVLGKAALLLGLGAAGGLAAFKIADDRFVDGLWQRLERAPGGGEVFTPQLVAGLPEPAQRYFLHAIRPGTPLAPRVHLAQTGSLRVGNSWASFSARQVLVAREGFVWKVRARIGGLPVRGTDHYAAGQGRMRIAAFGLVPIVNAGGPDLARSAIGRFAGEHLWLPSAWLPAAGAAVEPVDQERFAVTVTVDGEMTRVVNTVDPEGRLTSGRFERYGNQTADKRYQYIPFGSVVDAEGEFGGYTIPAQIRAGWWFGTDRYEETIRIAIASASYD
jgi:hypothetical protein